MMRSLWTAASGMTSQQFNVDNISNNLANVNTYGFKRERVEFKSLIYQTMKTADMDPATQTGRPVNLQVGLGVMPIATSRSFGVGNFERTDHNLDVAINGNGFFVVQRGEDDITYSRDGSFKVSEIQDEGLMIVSSEGYPILGIDDAPIVIPTEVPISDLNIDQSGNLSYTDAEGNFVELGLQINVVQFSNVQGLQAIGSNLFRVTSASGQPILESDGEVTKTSALVQGVLEMSNVNVAEEMVNMIVAQRAYELNSKAIQTSDSMLQVANDLKR